MMKNYIEKYAPSGEFEKSKVRVLVRGDLQDFVGETQGPVTRVESIFIVVSIAISLSFMTSRSSRLILPQPTSTLP